MSASWPTGRATVPAASKALESSSQYLGMPSERCATTASDCSMRVTLSTEVGLVAPSATTAAWLVRTVWRR